MNRKLGLLLVLCLLPMASVATTSAQSRPPSRPLAECGGPSGERNAAEEMTAQDREALAWATEFAGECAQLLERWIAGGGVTEEQLFARLYYPMPKTDPPKFATDYDSLADRDLPSIEERFVAKSSNLQYAVLTDVNGYVPTHNQRYAQPLTGNRAVDLINNRTKRLFLDRTGFAAARNEASHLLQRYQRDTGERMADISVPVRVKGKHWGAVRMGYRQVEK